MAFDSQTRNKLQRMVGACRRLLADEFDDQLQGLYGIYAQDGRVLDLEKLTSLDDDHHQTATLLRSRINHLTSGMASEKQPLAEAVRRVLREQAFTQLNRFAALRMAEERGFVQECVGQGLKSKGFQVFETVARSGLGDAYERYATFIYGMFDELSLDLGVLFDRWSPFGLLFPREPALLKFFELLNDPEVKPLWREDETIGWIYQYFNGNDVKEMREAANGGAPRNSRELAVRNQFFTPRYVVKFLTDNTLGRIWYEMTQRETKLKDLCRYLVRRPNEIFLNPGENAPPTGSSRGNESQTSSSKADQSLTSAAKMTQEELLKQPIFIPHRPLKDPRTILMLDPACGSMHFGLYAFDLFEIIYAEWWDRFATDTQKAEVITDCQKAEKLPLQEIAGVEAKRTCFLRHVPRLIIENNLHGIDIDPRCVQIAGLSLWLRAQKTWQRLGLKPAERPSIKRSNIVCAEPMPGEKELLREFVEREFPTEKIIFFQLLERIFDNMQLAGEAGSLLKIEEEIRSAVEEERAKNQGELDFDGKRLTSDEFWQQFENRIYDALREYAEHAENGGGFQRRLFAEDAARGFAFIDVCRKRYDVVLMNPPFGEVTLRTKGYLIEHFPVSYSDIYTCFVDRFVTQAQVEGRRVGVISNRTFLTLGAHTEFRLSTFFNKGHLEVLADLGSGVLDAMVEVASYVISCDDQSNVHPVFFPVHNKEDKAGALLKLVENKDACGGVIRSLVEFSSTLLRF